MVKSNLNLSQFVHSLFITGHYWSSMGKKSSNLGRRTRNARLKTLRRNALIDPLIDSNSQSQCSSSPTSPVSSRKRQGGSSPEPTNRQRKRPKKCDPGNVCIPKNLRNCVLSYDPMVDYSVLTKVGRMNKECSYCAALCWTNERPGLCCSNGKTSIPLIEGPPEPLSSLVNGSAIDSKHFLDNIRKYNSCFQMTSFGANEVSTGGFKSTFKVQGQVYHRVGSLLPSNNENPKFLQIYFMGDNLQQAKDPL